MTEDPSETFMKMIRDKVIEFPNGLPGFPASRQFVMAQKPEERPFSWMQSISDPGLSFALVDAYSWDKDFTLEVDDAELEEMGSVDPLDYAVYFILQIDQQEEQTTLTARPQTPLLVNVRNRQARQFSISANPAREPAEALSLKL